MCYSFKLVLEGKQVKIRLEFLEKFSAQFCFTRCRKQNLWAVEKKRYSRFNFVENNISNSPKVLRVWFLGSNWLFCFISICKFDSFKNPFATITSLSELYLRIRRFFSLVQTKKVISMNYGSSRSSWKPWRWVRPDLIFSMRDIYINSNQNLPTKYTSSSRSIKFKHILHGTSLKWSQRPSQSVRE